MSDIETKIIMNSIHPLWDEFCEKLEGPDYCDFRQDENGKITWRCKGGMNKDYARAILNNYPNIDVEASLAYFEEHGGHCDCEILFNVDR